MTAGAGRVPSMRSSFAVETGLKLVRTRNYRHQASRRRWMGVVAILAIVTLGGVAGIAKAPGGQSARDGVFSYFQTEQESLK